MKRTVVKDEFERLEEGVQTLKVIDIDYDKNFDILKVTYANNKGVKNTDRYAFTKNDETPNNVAISIYSSFASRVLGLGAGDEFDDEDLKGKYFTANVKLVTGKPYTSTRTGKEVTPINVRLYDVKPADSFDDDLSSLDDLD